MKLIYWPLFYYILEKKDLKYELLKVLSMFENFN